MRRRATIRRPVPRRGMAAVMMIVVLMVLNLVIVGMVLSGARQQDLSTRRLETVRSFYAAEAGLNMAVRELDEATDEDGDGGIGTVSDDANDATDPAVGAARVVVTAAEDAGVTTVTSTGREGDALRRIAALTE